MRLRPSRRRITSSWASTIITVLPASAQADDPRGHLGHPHGVRGEAHLDLGVPAGGEDQAEDDQTPEGAVPQHCEVTTGRAPPRARARAGEPVAHVRQAQQDQRRHQVAHRVEQVDHLEGDRACGVDDRARGQATDADTEVEQGEVQPVDPLALVFVGERGEDGVLPGPDGGAAQPRPASSPRRRRPWSRPAPATRCRRPRPPGRAAPRGGRRTGRSACRPTARARGSRHRTSRSPTRRGCRSGPGRGQVDEEERQGQATPDGGEQSADEDPRASGRRGRARCSMPRFCCPGVTARGRFPRPRPAGDPGHPPITRFGRSARAGGLPCWPGDAAWRHLPAPAREIAVAATDAVTAGGDATPRRTTWRRAGSRRPTVPPGPRRGGPVAARGGAPGRAGRRRRAAGAGALRTRCGAVAARRRPARGADAACRLPGPVRPGRRRASTHPGGDRPARPVLVADLLAATGRPLDAHLAAAFAEIHRTELHD